MISHWQEGNAERGQRGDVPLVDGNHRPAGRGDVCVPTVVAGGQPTQLRLLTVDETAKRLRVCARTVWRLISKGTGPPTCRVGRKVFVLDEGLEAWLLDQASQLAPASTHENASPP
jgi:excisionase family DNA binding protein